MNPSEAGERIREARALLKKNAPKDALALLDPLLALDLPPTGALVLASECLRLIDVADGVERAEQYLRKALLMDPEHPDARLELAHLLFTYQDEVSDETFALLESAEKTIAEMDISALLLRIVRSRIEGRFDEARKLIEEGLRRHPQSKLLNEEKDWLPKSDG